MIVEIGTDRLGPVSRNIVARAEEAEAHFRAVNLGGKTTDLAATIMPLVADAAWQVARARIRGADLSADVYTKRSMADLQLALSAMPVNRAHAFSSEVAHCFDEATATWFAGAGRGKGWVRAFLNLCVACGQHHPPDADVLRAMRVRNLPRHKRSKP